MPVIGSAPHQSRLIQSGIVGLLCGASHSVIIHSLFFPYIILGSVAQLVEQCPFKALAVGSSPTRPTIRFAHFKVLSVMRMMGNT